MAREKRKKAHPAQADAVSFFEERKEQRRKQRKTIRKRWMFNSLGMVFLIVIVAVVAFTFAMANYYYSNMRDRMESIADNARVRILSSATSASEFRSAAQVRS